jgi:hypothetical protein
MNNTKTFKTKTGYCHVLSDKIVLTRDGIVGDLSKVVVGNSITRILVIYGLLSLGLLYFAYDNYQNNKKVETIIFGLLGLYLIYGIKNSLNNSATPIIERNKIKEVKLKKAVKGLTRSRFEVLFEDENGKIKKRMIMLPGSLSSGDTETQNAIQIFEEEKILTTANKS